MKKIRIVMADDHDVVRLGISALLSTVPEFEVVGQASDGEEAVSAVKKLNPDVVILDLEMPKMSGVDAAKIIKFKYPKTRILILSGFENEKYVTEILRSGSGGYVVKNVGKEELAEAIHTVAEGKRFFSPSVSRIMVEGLLRKHSAELAQLSHIREPLTDLEMEILSFLTQGLKPEQIGERLGISAAAVERHFTTLKKKLDITDVINLVKFAKDYGFVVNHP
ncbi:MAG TPA: response regulator transcription factor [Bacteroidota bacterium]|nr:response regulator transcription factor [Bacteroidota bacterium]